MAPATAPVIQVHGVLGFIHELGFIQTHRAQYHRKPMQERLCVVKHEASSQPAAIEGLKAVEVVRLVTSKGEAHICTRDVQHSTHVR